MRYVDEFRDPSKARAVAKAIHAVVSRDWHIMEICGGQTHAIVRFGIEQLIPRRVHLIHGPGCPVCVTPASIIDAAVRIALDRRVTLCTFGDMLRVPGTEGSLLDARARGAEVRIVYSPMEAMDLAARRPDREVVFLAIGFETTAPANALAVFTAKRKGLENFSVIVSHFLVPPAIASILESGNVRVDGFLAAGHVCTVMGWKEYVPIARRYRKPIVVTGFEPLDILQGLLLCVRQLEQGRAEVENQYSRSVRPEGNPRARQLVAEVFEVVTGPWRGIGVIPRGRLGLRPPYREFDALGKFGIEFQSHEASSGPCIAGKILRGSAKPSDCPAFGNPCTPDHPLGAPMVSSEGACHAYFLYCRKSNPDHA